MPNTVHLLQSLRTIADMLHSLTSICAHAFGVRIETSMRWLEDCTEVPEGFATSQDCQAPFYHKVTLCESYKQLHSRVIAHYQAIRVTKWHSL
jgi:hypothetical protein